MFASLHTPDFDHFDQYFADLVTPQSWSHVVSKQRPGCEIALGRIAHQRWKILGVEKYSHCQARSYCFGSFRDPNITRWDWSGWLCANWRGWQVTPTIAPGEFCWISQGVRSGKHDQIQTYLCLGDAQSISLSNTQTVLSYGWSNHLGVTEQESPEVKGFRFSQRFQEA